MREAFRRLHVFDGMLVTDEDFNAITTYHQAKARLHGRAFHGPGVVAHVGAGLRVRASDPPSMKVTVGAGLAVDAEGRELHLADAATLPIDLDALGPPGQPFTGALFVLLSYVEDADDFAASEVDPRLTGHSRVEEGTRLRLSTEPPRPHELELARIHLGPEVQRIVDASGGQAPHVGEIDLRFVELSGQGGGALRGGDLTHLVTSLRSRRALLGRWLVDFEVAEAQLPRPALSQAVTLLYAGALGGRALVAQLAALLSFERELATLLRRRTGEWERVWVSLQWRAYEASLGQAWAALALLDVDPWPNLAPSRWAQEVQRAVELYRAVDPPLQRLTDDLAGLLERGAASGPLYKEMTEAELAVLGSDPPTRLALSGRPFVLIDRLEPTQMASIEAHHFRVDAGPNDVVQGTTPALYPDGSRVVDQGLAYRRGSIYFHVNNVSPGRDLLIVRRVELRELDVQEEVRMDEQPIGVWSYQGDDTRHPWRNVLFAVDRGMLVGPRPRVRLSLREGSSPSNLYRCWFYQAV